MRILSSYVKAYVTVSINVDKKVKCLKVSASTYLECNERLVFWLNQDLISNERRNSKDTTLKANARNHPSNVIKINLYDSKTLTPKVQIYSPNKIEKKKHPVLYKFLYFFFSIPWMPSKCTKNILHHSLTLLAQQDIVPAPTFTLTSLFFHLIFILFRLVEAKESF